MSQELNARTAMLTDRRRWLQSAAVGALIPGLSVMAHQRAGPVTPSRAMPQLQVVGSTSQTLELSQWMRGRITAVQLMFTGCSATCPIQGATFAQAQQQLAQASLRLALLSVTIDPLNDDPRALAGWLQRFGATPPRWTAVAPVLSQADNLRRFLLGSSGAQPSSTAEHTTQVFLFNTRAELVFATSELPSGDQVARLMSALDKTS